MGRNFSYSLKSFGKRNHLERTEQQSYLTGVESDILFFEGILSFRFH